MHTLILERSDVPAAFLRAFPCYNGRKFRAVASETVSVTGTYWDGGSRCTYVLFRLDGIGPVARCAPDHPAFDRRGVEGNTYPIPEGFGIAEHSIFCGKDMGITFHVRPEVLAPLLPAPVDLSDDERAVLAIMRGLIPAARPEAYRRAIKGDHRPVLAALESRGCLKTSKAGAVSLTIEGKRAAEGLAMPRSV